MFGPLVYVPYRLYRCLSCRAWLCRHSWSRSGDVPRVHVTCPTLHMPAAPHFICLLRHTPYACCHTFHMPSCCATLHMPASTPHSICLPAAPHSICLLLCFVSLENSYGSLAACPAMAAAFVTRLPDGRDNARQEVLDERVFLAVFFRSRGAARRGAARRSGGGGT